MLNLKNTLDGYLKNVEVIGNTIQDTSNLADIRSVGNKVEGQELYKIDIVSCGKNLFNKVFKNKLNDINGVTVDGNGVITINGTVSHHIMFDVVIPKGEYRATTFSDTRTALHVFWEGNDSGFQCNRALSYAEDRTLKCYIASGTYDNYICKFQLEEGTVATEYEPYQEQKLEILSPVQLEKVGDVADRIICKDGVWGVEKNITKVNLKDLSFVIYSETNDMIVFNSNISIKQKGNFYGISNKLIYSSSAWNNSIIEDSVGLDSTSLRIFVKFRKSTVSTLEEFNKFKEDLFLLYQRDVCAFISLPHDQQVKLRTFAGQTNIAFLTEIAGQIKAQVPKSLGATVNTHTEQIADLHNSLDRVKKLEETTVSTVETECSFTTVSETSNGYFEDVKLEGNTLVNKSRIKSKHIISSGDRLCNVFLGQNLSQFTLIVDVSNLNGTLKSYGIYADNNQDIYTQTTDVNGKWITYFNLNRPIKEFTLYVDGGTNHGAILDNIVVLEGDHTNNPPSYFEGLMSVGQDVEKVSVDSASSGNLANGVTYGGYYYNSPWGNGNNTISKAESKNAKTSSKIKVFPNATYFYNAVGGNRCVINFFKNKSDELPYSGVKLNNSNIPTGTFSTDSECNYIEVYAGTGVEISNLFINLGDKQVDKEYQSNKKPLLYFNPTTETWEKPILREWDTIEKHSDGKYYYHKRSGEVVLNGTERWIESSTGYLSNLHFYAFITGKIGGKIIHNRGNDLVGTTYYDKHSIIYNNTERVFSTVNDFKQWLQANPTTVVYQLAQEEVYECTNIDLMTYSGETNYIINSGAISPKSLLKVHNNISNVVKILQEKVSLLENTFIAGLKSVLSGDMYSLATILYPEDFEQNDNTEQDIMVIPE